ncbi:hypothetical protein SAMN05421753_108101 [Planctomicrobium piriforme]|uniref:ChpI protein n=1 Tax=Planctomicrobium piriforme TaxID=1576369 RepID=A0A1I3HL24_9PLAN|nr:hypothetical protein SAMN05421753_108101 [Planctomicrobium piriforme]
MKTAISIPDPVFLEAEDAARRLKMSRSELYTKAVKEFLENHGSGDAITSKLNEVYADNDSKLDPVISEIQRRSIGPEKW